jgi:single-stranded-DNA-specific exonuclease
VIHQEQKRWLIAPPAPSNYLDRLAEDYDIHPVLAQVLYNRGFDIPEAALEFLARHYLADDNPFLLKGMAEATYRLRLAIRRGDPIVVYGDFDADGVTSTVLLTEVLTRLGANVRPYIPDRVDEGYGLNSPALKALAEDGVRVVVTVDCGIRSVKEVEDGISCGLDMIVSDHHSVGSTLPPALAVINPRQPGDPYPEKGLAGVGVTYKLVQALYMEAQRRGYRADDPWRPDDWLDLVAIGTVADIVPLRGENRALVRRGLALLNNPVRSGLKALYGTARIKPGHVDATAIGFMIGPRINAAGRLRSAMMAFDLLTAANQRQAVTLATELNDVNRERQEKTSTMQTWAEEHIPGDPSGEPLLFAADERFEQGVVGLVASRLTDQYYRPAVVVQVGEEESHGSCRSIPEFHITHALEECDDLLERYGGHAAAAGFTVRNDRIAPLQERLTDVAGSQLVMDELLPTVDVDAELPLEEATLALAGVLTMLEPTGEGNRPPLFASRHVRVQESRVVGSEGSHLKLTLSSGAHLVEAIAFRQGEWYGHLPDFLDIAYELQVHEWNNRQEAQLIIRDLRPAEDA